MEMDSLMTILLASAVVAEEWRQPNRSDPREDYDLVVVRRRTVRLFREGAHTLLSFMTRLLLFPVSGDTSTSDVDVVMELSNLRHDMVSYEASYPAAVQVRNHLGDEIWDGLEDYRCRVAFMAFSTLRLQQTDPIDFPERFQAFLNQYVPHMETYILARWGQDDLDLFHCVCTNFEDLVEEGRDEGEIQESWPMQVTLTLFRGQPMYWLAFNLFFPADGRMSWEQVSIWAIYWLEWTNMEPPAWPMQLRGLYAWNPDTTPIWNRAVLELFGDIGRRFRYTHTLAS